MRNKVLVFVFLFIMICSIANISMCFDYVGFVIYGGKTYIIGEIVNYNKETQEAFIGKYIGRANKKELTNEGILSGENKTKNFDSSIEGDIYSVKGYNKSFRICILDKSSSKIVFFENVEDITTGMKGKKLYGNTLHLKRNIKDIQYQLFIDVRNGEKNYQQFKDISDDDINKFINALYKAQIIELDSGIFYEPAQLTIYFKMQDGMTIPLNVFINGYVSYIRGFKSCFVKIDQKIVQKLFDASELKGQFSSLDIDETKYLVSNGRDYIYRKYLFIAVVTLIILGVIYIIIKRKSKRITKNKSI